MSFAQPRRCKGHTRQGAPCGGPAISGREYCRKHGGKRARGILAPRYGPRTPTSTRLPGQQSKYIPVKLAADYRASQADPERLSLLHEIATWTAREQELLRRIDPHDAGASWQAVAQAWEQITTAKQALDTAQAARDIPGMRAAYDRLQAGMDAGTKGIALAQLDYGLWKEIKACHDMLLRLRTQEHTRLLDLQKYWNSEQVALRWGQFLHALWEACTAKLPPAQIRPLLTDFQWRIRSIDEEFLDLPATEQPTPAGMPPSEPVDGA